jgi:hypothetical protein
MTSHAPCASLGHKRITIPAATPGVSGGVHLYREVSHIPLLVHDPRAPARQGETCAALSQTMDLAPSVLDLFGLQPAPLMEGIALRELRAGGTRREAVMFGYFGGAVNIADGQYTYHRFPPNLLRQEIHQYTLMPTHIFSPFSVEELSAARLAGPLPFTKGARVLQVPVIERSPFFSNYGPGALLESETRLYDIVADPGQQKPLRAPEVEARMIALMTRLMVANHAPPEAFARLEIAPI